MKTIRSDTNVRMRILIIRLRMIVIGVFSILLLFIGCHGPLIEKRQVYIVFRYDDYSALSATDMELRIIDAFHKNKASVTFGVIPFVTAGHIHDLSPGKLVPLAGRKKDILKAGFKDGTIDIALHGYSHQTIDADEWREFSGLDYHRQLERLTQGKKFIEAMIDAPVKTFVPPWNKYDLNTLRALEELGFSTLSASRSGEAPRGADLDFLPATSSLSNLRDAVKSAKAFSEAQSVIVVLFHAYDFKEVDGNRGCITYREFADLLGWLKRQEGVCLLSISQAVGSNGLSNEQVLPEKEEAVRRLRA